MRFRPVRLLTAAALCLWLTAFYGAAHAAALTATPATIWTVLHDTARGGDTVSLSPGQYGAQSYRLFSYTSPVVITAQPGAVFTSLTLNTVNNMTWRGLEVTGLGTNGAAVTLYSPTAIRFETAHVHGAGNGTAFSLRDVTGVAVVDSEIDHMGSGINYLDGTGVTLTGDTFHDLQTDGVIGAANSVLIDGNSFKDFRPAVGDHPDAIQWYGSAATPNPNGVTITRNIIERGAGAAIQGIFGEQGTNIVIRGNAMLGTMYNGISVCGGATVAIDTNFVQGYTDMWSQEIVRCGSSNITVSNSTTNALTNYVETDGTRNTNFVASGTVIVPTAAIGDRTAYVAWLAAHGGPAPPVPPVCPVDPQIAVLQAQAAALTAQNVALQTQVTTLTATVAKDTAAFATIRAALPR